MKRIARAVSSAGLPALGQPFGGGFYAGRYFLRGEERALVVADQSAGFVGQWWDAMGPRPSIEAQDFLDGMANTRAMAAAGSAAAAKVLLMRSNGQGEWHIPARDELVLLQVNLLQLAAFQFGGEQALRMPLTYGEYWSSTQKRSGRTGLAWCLNMKPGCTADTNWAIREKMIRPVRSIPIIPEPDAMDLPAEGVIVDRIPFAGYPAGRLTEILERFINEDAGRFYGRTEDLVAELNALSGVSPRHEMTLAPNVAQQVQV